MADMKDLIAAMRELQISQQMVMADINAMNN
jgi:hypothetical protein